MAEVSRPGSFSAAILVEPIVLPPPYHVAESHPLAEAARRRIDRFSSEEAAFSNYRGKGPFARWDDRVLRAYVAGGFRADDDGVVLRCAPESEAQFFLHASAHGMWDRLGEIRPDVLLIAGERSDSHPQPVLASLAARIPSVSTEIVSGASHFAPMEFPGLIADRIASVIAAVSGPDSDDQAEPE
jgi:pimeloyl-ACP methyl ester carboxylesterase